MDVDWSEVRTGLARTRPFLLSHHVPAEYHRCYAPEIRGRRIRLCARCTGIYPGIVAGLWAFFGAPVLPRPWWFVAVLPLPALLDWSLTAFTPREGSNPGRTGTGLLLGYGYGLGLGHLFVSGNVLVLLVGFCYGFVAAALLWYREQRAQG